MKEWPWNYFQEDPSIQKYTTLFAGEGEEWEQ